MTSRPNKLFAFLKKHTLWELCCLFAMQIWVWVCMYTCLNMFVLGFMFLMRKGCLIYQVMHVLYQWLYPQCFKWWYWTHGSLKLAIVCSIQRMNSRSLFISSSLHSKRLYITLRAGPLICLYVASHAFASHPKMTWSSLSSRAHRIDWPFHTHSHTPVPYMILSGDPWHNKFSWFRFIAVFSCSWSCRGCQSDEKKTWKCTPNGALISGADLAHQQFSVDQGTLQKNNQSLSFEQVPGWALPVNRSVKNANTGCTHANLRDCISYSHLSWVEIYLSPNDPEGCLVGRCWSPETCPFMKSLLAFKELQLENPNTKLLTHCH